MPYSVFHLLVILSVLYWSEHPKLQHEQQSDCMLQSFERAIPGRT